MTRAMLATETGLTLPAISRITRELLDAGILLEGEAPRVEGRTGRRETFVAINPNGAFVLAVTLTANRRDIVIANASGDILQSDDCNDLDTADPRRFLEMLAARAKNLVFDADFHRSRLLGVGVSVAVSSSTPGPDNDDLITSNPLGWKDVPIRTILSKALKLPVHIEHRASAILHAELKRAEREEDTFLVNVALGLGVSSYLGGRFLVTGMRGLGSISHLAIPNDPTPCSCGRTGCLETTASGHAVVATLGKSTLPLQQQSKILTEAVLAAKSGDREAKRAFRAAGHHMAYGINAIDALLNPAKIIIAGEVGRQPDYFEELVKSLNATGNRAATQRLSKSSITSVEASISAALQKYLLTGSLNLKQLSAA